MLFLKENELDLTQGSVSVLLIQFALPILLGQIFQNLYNSVDSLIVGQFVGKEALAAVTCCSDISQLLVGFFTGLSAGAGILLSLLYGERFIPHWCSLQFWACLWL